MKIDITTENPTSLRDAIYKKIKDGEVTAWIIKKNTAEEILLTHVAGQYTDKVLLKLFSFPSQNLLRVETQRWSTEPEAPIANKATIVGNFVATLLTHFPTHFSVIKSYS